MYITLFLRTLGDNGNKNEYCPTKKTTSDHRNNNNSSIFFLNNSVNDLGFVLH